MDIAFQCFQCTAHLGNPKGQCNLGLCYLSGLGCHQDTELGFQWISLAADFGLPIVFLHFIQRKQAAVLVPATVFFYNGKSRLRITRNELETTWVPTLLD